MRLEVRIRLLRTALAFYRFLDEPIYLSDIVLTGSNAAYNWTPLSDVDVHLITDFDRAPCPALAENFFNTKRSLWNETHEISIRGHDVEIYVEDDASPARSAGSYSILRGVWLHKPSHVRPRVHDAAVLAKASHFADEIDDLLDGKPDSAAVEKMLSRVYDLRQKGLAHAAGEYSTENLAFKTLRNLGFLDRLKKARTSSEDRSLSLEGNDQP